MPRVWNKRDPNCPKDAVYVGRPTKYGNPYVMGKDGNREEVITLYKEWLFSHGGAELCKEAKKELAGKDLICWCAPKPCHADVLLEFVN